MSIAILKKVETAPASGAQPTVFPIPGSRARSRVLLASIGFLALACGGGFYGHHWYAVGRFIESTNNAYLRADQVAMAPRVSGQVAFTTKLWRVGIRFVGE